MTGLPVVTSKLLDVAGVRHAFFTRNGGVSAGLYETLNVGLGSDDDPDAVLENRRRCAGHFGAENLVTAYQTHSALAISASGPWPHGPPQADGLVTSTPGLVLGALAADCAPVLLVDPRARVAAAAHAGWKGALGGVVEATITRMESLGAQRRHLRAAVGPCIGPASYEVGLEFLERFASQDPEFVKFFAPGAVPEKRLFDLPGFVLGRLAAAGVPACEWVGRDTCAEPQDFFSNRRAFKLGEADFGRLASAIQLT